MLKDIFLHSVAVLFVAFIIFLVIKTFFNLFLSFKHYRKGLTEDEKGIHTVETIRPMVFIKLFANCLTVVFFPQYILQLVLASHLPGYISSFIYVTYQLFFILMLIPGGYLVEVKNPKKILLIATLIECLLLLMFGLSHNFWQALIIQVLFGCTIPLSSSAEYAYILNLSSEKTRNYALALYSNTLKGAAIAGIVAGGFLTEHTHPRAVFFIASGLVFLMLIYILFVIPQIRNRQQCRANARVTGLSFKFILSKLPAVFRNLTFVKTLFCVGFPLGVLNDGVVLFSLPLLLSHYQFQHNLIGQMMALFSIGFFATNKYISQQADISGNEKPYLFFGLFGVALSLVLISGLAFKSNTIGFEHNMSVLMFICGLFGLGVFRGFLFSPGNAYISKHPVTVTIGKNVALSLYRLFQTLGSIVGPIGLGFLLINMKYSAFVYIFIAALFFILALILNIKAHKEN